ncbi:MAG: MYXO-CTERM domain-containing protein [Myxococcota bacterium]|jgi:MYXO-CTERM domain-containing protein
MSLPSKIAFTCACLLGVVFHGAALSFPQDTAANSADVAEPPPPTGWNVALFNPVDIPLEGVLFFAARYTVGFDSSVPLEVGLDTLITVTVTDDAAAVLQGTFSYDANQGLAEWRSAGPLTPAATYGLELILQHHDGTPSRTLTFEMVAATMPLGDPAAAPVPFSQNAGFDCEVESCCLPFVSIQGPAAGAEVSIEIAFPALDGTWEVSVTQSGAISYSGFHVYDALTEDSLCYRISTISRVNDARTDSVRCIPNPSQDEILDGDTVCVLNTDTGRVESENPMRSGDFAPSDSGCSAAGGSPGWLWVALVLGGLWAVRRETTHPRVLTGSDRR